MIQCVSCKYKIQNNQLVCPNCGFVIPRYTGAKDSYEKILSEIGEEYRKANNIAVWKESVKATTKIKTSKTQNQDSLQTVVKNQNNVAAEDIRKGKNELLLEGNDITVTPENNTEVLIKQLLDDAFAEVTINGPIIVEDSLTTNTYIEIVDGIKIDRGFISPYMIQDEERVETILEDPYILITNAILTESIAIQKIADLVNPTKKSLLIIATYVEKAALSEIVKRLDSFPCVAVMAPSYGDKRIEILKDIAILTGGTAIIATNEKCVNGITLENLGQAEKVIVRSEETIIVNGKGDKNALKERKYHILKLKEQSYSEFDKEKLQERYENLNRGVAVIKVGGKTVSETRRVMAMIDTALFALRNSTYVSP